MPIYTRSTTDILITSKPCILYSITMTNFGGGEGRVDIHDGQAADENYRVVTVTQGSNDTDQFHWKGLNLSRGLYVNIVERTDAFTIEWEHQEHQE